VERGLFIYERGERILGDWREESESTVEFTVHRGAAEVLGSEG
jgi:hypothetical protein